MTRKDWDIQYFLLADIPLPMFVETGHKVCINGESYIVLEIEGKFERRLDSIVTCKKIVQRC